jgi:hypothetical protein
MVFAELVGAAVCLTRARRRSSPPPAWLLGGFSAGLAIWRGIVNNLDHTTLCREDTNDATGIVSIQTR